MFQILLAGGGEPARLFLSRMLWPLVRPAPVWRRPGRRLIFLPEGGPLPEGLARRGDTAIVSAESERQLFSLSESPAQAIVCGRSSKDTVTFSSVGEGRASVSLLRRIRGWDGRPVEPMDLTVDFPPGSREYLVLAAAAAAMYFCLPPEHLQKFSSYNPGGGAYNISANAADQESRKQGV